MSSYQLGLRKVCSKLYPQFHHVRKHCNTSTWKGKNELSALKLKSNPEDNLKESQLL